MLSSGVLQVSAGAMAVHSHGGKQQEAPSCGRASPGAARSTAHCCTQDKPYPSPGTSRANQAFRLQTYPVPQPNACSTTSSSPTPPRAAGLGSSYAGDL